jgi:hypothetical protein
VHGIPLVCYGEALGKCINNPLLLEDPLLQKTCGPQVVDTGRRCSISCNAEAKSKTMFQNWKSDEQEYQSETLGQRQSKLYQVCLWGYERQQSPLNKKKL